MSAYDIYGPNLRNGTTPHGETFVIHKAGCAHGKRGDLKNAPCERNAEYASLTEIVDSYYPPCEFDCESGEYAGDFYLAPCVKACSL